MKRALMYASVASMIQQFNMENIRLLLSMGYEVDVACNMEQGSTITPEKIEAMKNELLSMGVQVFHVPVPRSISALGSMARAFWDSRKLMNRRKYDLIHCHSPIGGMLCRLANRTSAHRAKMIYTAHGFHFYKGAPLKNWLLFYPVEKLCSRFTDVLITINREDYALASEAFHADKVVYVPGIGINLGKFGEKIVDISKKREELGCPRGKTLLLSVGELNQNKNHETVLCALGELDAHYVIAGQGPLREQLESLRDQLGLREKVAFLGYRNDVKELYEAADVFVFPSYREGLSVSLMEAMASGLPCVVSAIRGNTDLIDENGGALFAPNSVSSCHKALLSLLDKTPEEQQAMGVYNKEKVKSFGIEPVQECMRALYSE